jgi:hypothetical protein
MNLPKWLVQKLGKEKVTELAGTYVPTPHKVASRSSDRSSALSTGKQAARRKYKNIQAGLVEPEPLYSVDEALEKAGL